MSQQIQGQTPANSMSRLCNSKDRLWILSCVYLSELYNDECETESVCQLDAKLLVWLHYKEGKEMWVL